MWSISKVNCNQTNMCIVLYGMTHKPWIIRYDSSLMTHSIHILFQCINLRQLSRGRQYPSLASVVTPSYYGNATLNYVLTSTTPGDLQLYADLCESEVKVAQPTEVIDHSISHHHEITQLTSIGDSILMSISLFVF